MSTDVQERQVKQTAVANRPIVHITRGRSHGAITRLMSPGDLGQILKPFVFLDWFDTDNGGFPGFNLHPHSGIATLTHLIEGSTTYEDTTGATGVLRGGGVEWMRAGKGIWHGGGAGEPGRTRGFQLWLALPGALELGPPESRYLSAADIPNAGPASVLLGTHAGRANSIDAPSPINYLAVTLRAGQRWDYTPPAGHSVLWLAVARGAINAGRDVARGELAVFEAGEGRVEIEATSDTDFVLGSAAPHPHELVTGYYSVHTSEAALEEGEARIRELGKSIQRQGRR
jgi:redox-sensitive bicupin YhaK (pirin superfamily)